VKYVVKVVGNKTYLCVSIARKMQNIKIVHTNFRLNLPPGREVEIEGIVDTHGTR